HTPLNLNVKPILPPTQTPSTPPTISKYPPHSHIIALTPTQKTPTQSPILWRLNPLVKQRPKTTHPLLNNPLPTTIQTATLSNAHLIII
ncbi:pyruvate kinase alpha/beta domain-containing protein, partial [Staphylococcus epidermidis]|uniref:pyruvate kinase alpha/beta domain-containing protein n=1 Tax=Staphylococcus epidermidis TaxID=1282 RepID=UPI0037D9E79B